MARRAIPSTTYVLCVVRRGAHYLLVQERKHGQTWFLPSGGVEAGESFFDAARRETLEEAGVPIDPQGVLGCDHTWIPGPGGLAIKLRVVLLCAPRADVAPKQVPDRHTLGARWVTPAEARALPLRAAEVVRWIEHVDQGGLVMPLRAFESTSLSTERDALVHSLRD
ncbi:MAG: NUDIX domain-containing protein [Planctomycetota bacterium]